MPRRWEGQVGAKLTCEQSHVVDCKVEPESVLKCRSLGELSEIGSNAAQELSKQGLAVQKRDRDISWQSPSANRDKICQCFLGMRKYCKQGKTAGGTVTIGRDRIG